jgi:hypothetical protein
LKHEYALSPLRTRGLARVQLHTDLTMLARLSQALAEPAWLPAYNLPPISPRFRDQVAGKEPRVVIAASTVAIVAIAAAVIVALIVLMYIVPRGGRRRRPKL